MGFGTINWCSIHDELERQNHNVVHSSKTILKERESDEFLRMSFDKWKADGAAEISDLLKQRLTLFDMSLSNVDVQRVARIEEKITFPCLAHVINLFAKCISLNMDEVDDDDHDESDVLKTKKTWFQLFNVYALRSVKFGERQHWTIN